MSRIESSVFRDTTSIMNLGIILGAMLAAGLAGKFKPTWWLSRVDLLSAIIGGLIIWGFIAWVFFSWWNDEQKYGAVDHKVRTKPS